MPNCLECPERDGNTCRAHVESERVLKRPLPPPPIGACMIPVVKTYLPMINNGHHVLEIGCGTWSLLKDHCQKVGAHYEGIDVQSEYYGEKVIATRLENLAALSFADQQFDFVIGNQTMEHWAEHGCTMEWGLYQCFRVLKPGGSLFLNVPIYFHGTKYFLHGELGNIKKLFSGFSDQVRLISWGENPAPFPPFFAHPNFSKLHNKSAYIMDIHAVRDRELPRGISNRMGFHGKLAQIFHYSFSYNLYRLMQKIGAA